MAAPGRRHRGAIGTQMGALERFCAGTDESSPRETVKCGSAGGNALERGGSNAASRELREPGQGVVEHAETPGSRRKLIAQGPLGSDRGDRGSCGARMVDDANDLGALLAPPATAHLNADRAGSAFGMWWSEHRKNGSESIATRRGHPGSDSLHVGKRGNQQERVGKCAAIAVARAQRIRKPHQLTAGPSRAPTPVAVAKVDREPGPGSMELPSKLLRQMLSSPSGPASVQ